MYLIYIKVSDEKKDYYFSKENKQKDIYPRKQADTRLS